MVATNKKGEHQLVTCVQLRNAHDMEMMLLKVAEASRLRPSARIWLDTDPVHIAADAATGPRRNDVADDENTGPAINYGRLWALLLPKIVEWNSMDHSTSQMTLSKPVTAVLGDDDGMFNMAFNG